VRRGLAPCGAHPNDLAATEVAAGRQSQPAYESLFTGKTAHVRADLRQDGLGGDVLPARQVEITLPSPAIVVKAQKIPRQRGHTPDIPGLRDELIRICGVDLTTVDGISVSMRGALSNGRPYRDNNGELGGIGSKCLYCRRLPLPT